MTPPVFEEMTDVQKAFWEGMTDQRVANMWEAADFIAGLTNDQKDFITDADPETLKFLKDMRPDEVKQLEGGIRTYNAFMTTGRVLRTAGIIGFGIFVGLFTIWDTVAKWLKVAK